MNETSKQQVIMVKPKTAAPMILGVIAFVLSIPGVLCTAVCATVATDASGSATPFLFLLPPVVGFILSFFCKTKISTLTGIMVLLVGLYETVTSLPANLLGIVAGILFIVAGALSISNTKRPAA